MASSTLTNESIPTNESCAALQLDGVAAADLSLLFVLFVGLGITVRLNEFRAHFAHPRGVLVALLVQFVCMPAIGYGLASTFDDAAYRIGLVVQLCAPGGALSNMMALVFRMDVPLSIAMTTASSIVAMAAMPLNLYIYLRLTGLVGSEACVSVGGIFISTAMVVMGVATGLAARMKLPMRWLDRILTISTLSGVAILVIGIVYNTRGRRPLWETPPIVVGLTVFSGIIGTLLGFSLALAVRLTRPRIMAVAVETGIQNKILANAVIAVVVVDPHQRDTAFAIPFFYGVFSSVFTVLWSLLGWRLGWTNMRPNDRLWHGLVEAREEMKRDKAALLGGEIEAELHQPPDNSGRISVV